MRSREILSEHDRLLIRTLINGSKASNLLKLSLEAAEAAEQEIEELKKDTNYMLTLIKRQDKLIHELIDSGTDNIIREKDNKIFTLERKLETYRNKLDNYNVNRDAKIEPLYEYSLEDLAEMEADSQIAINKQYEGMEENI